MKDIVYDRRFDPPVPMMEGPDGELVVDRRQQRLEQRKCPDCPDRLRAGRGPKGWFRCRCCGRMWRRQSNGRYAEQINGFEFCQHYQPLSADQRTGSAAGPADSGTGG